MRTVNGRRRARASAARHFGAAGAFLALWVLSGHTEAGQALDARAFSWVAPLHNAWLEVAAGLRRGLPAVAAVAVLAVALVAVRHRRWRTLGVAGGILIAAGVGAFVARSVLPRPDLGDHAYAYNTFPSLNVAVVAGLCVAATILWPAGGRRWVAKAGAVVALLAATASVVTYAHRPSDVIGSLLLVAVLVPSLQPVPQRQPSTVA